MMAAPKHSKASVRRAEVVRETRETQVRVYVDLDRGGPVSIATGIGFFDHMLEALGLHGGLKLEVEGKGDLHVDQHHLVEDVGIALGSALREALGEDLRIRRFAHCYAPLDDALARAVVDVSGRAYFYWGVSFGRQHVGEFDTDLVEEFFRALVHNARVNLHVDLVRGANTHHEVEAVFKAVALTLRQAFAREPQADTVPSTKGALSEERARRR